MHGTLIDERPDIAEQLVDKTLGSKLTCKSGKMQNWVCADGHEWSATVANRTRASGGSCPFCSGKNVMAGINDLATTDPHIAAQLVDQDLGKTVFRRSGRKLEWKCDFGHQWTAVIASRTSGSGCPKCSGYTVEVGETDLATKRPDLAAQLVDQSWATKVTAGSAIVLQWMCEDGHVWEAPVDRRSGKQGGCPYCCNQKVTTGKTDLMTTHPDLARQLVDIADALTVSAGSGKKLEWQCGNGHRWFAVVGSRSNGNGCPKCSGHRIEVGETDLLTTHPELAAQLVDQELATVISRGSNLRAKWVCSSGHQWNAAVSSRTIGHDCPTCFGTGYRQDEQEARLYLILPPGKHPIGYGKVHSEQRYDYAMSVSYEGCQPLAYAVGTGRSVSDAETCLNMIKGRPTGKIERLQRESLERSHASINLWEQAAMANGLEIVWLVDRTSIVLEEVKPRLHAELDFCGCKMDGLNRHDSILPCCKQARREATTILAANHYLGSGPTTTIHYFTWRINGRIKAIMTLGTGSNSRNGKSLSTYSGIRSLELTRLWASPDLGITLSSFVSKCLDTITYPLFVYSYADASKGHTGGIYRACSFNYAGWSDMLRSKPLRRQPDKSTPFADWPILSAKHRYWKLIGLKGTRRADALEAAGWPTYDPRILGFAPPDSHRRASRQELDGALPKIG